MNELSESFVNDHVDKWVNALNKRDLKKVLYTYADDIQFFIIQK